jgi:hypothetical protein
MATIVFDITDKVIKFVSEVIDDMPGNPGQEVLVEKLIKTANGLVLVIVEIEEDGVDIEVIGYIRWKSNHPEAIKIIIKKAEDWTDLIINQSKIPGPWDLDDAVETGNWKIVGYDQ